MAAQRRDQLARDITDELASLNLEGWVRKSQPGEYPLAVALDLWRPVASSEVTATHDRAHLKIDITVNPYMRDPLNFHASLNRHSKSFAADHWDLSRDELNQMVRYVVRGGSKPSFFRPRIPPILLILASVFPPLLLLTMSDQYTNKLIPEARRKWFTFPTLLGLGGIAAAIVYFLSAADKYNYYQYTREPELDPTWDILLGGVGLVACVAAFIWSGRRPVLNAVAKQPQRTPRREFVVDSWQVSVPEGGVEFRAFRDRLWRALASLGAEHEFSIETHQSLTPRGFDERERLVITKAQANLHIHIQPFGRDAFVGWDSYLNWLKWAETEPVSQTVKDGRRIEYRSLTSGVHIPSKFDLMELNALAETAHRLIVSEIKAFLREKEIEADLDYKIIRGDRAAALREEKSKTTAVHGGVGALRGG